MDTRQTFLALVIAGCATALLTAAPARAQQPANKMSETSAAKTRGAGADENIKVARAPNVHNAATPAPATKGGEKTRGPVSSVHVDNWTPWSIDAYMDGSYCGTVPAWGDIWCYVGTGNTRMYARADFGQADSCSWGPVINYVDGEYRWRLNRGTC